MKKNQKKFLMGVGKRLVKGFGAMGKDLMDAGAHAGREFRREAPGYGGFPREPDFRDPFAPRPRTSSRKKRQSSGKKTIVIHVG